PRSGRAVARAARRGGVHAVPAAGVRDDGAFRRRLDAVRARRQLGVVAEGTVEACRPPQGRTQGRTLVRPSHAGPAMATRLPKSRTPARRAASMSEDLALIAVLIAAINANQHITAAEGGRAMHLLWSMRRFRQRDGEELDRLIDEVRQRINAQGDDAVVE